MIPATLVFIKKEDEVLLIYKKRGFGSGKWNAPGGKIENGETPLQAAIRETYEEVNLQVQNITKVAEFNFWADDVIEWKGFVFLGNDFSGEMAESEEALPQWWKISEIPYDKMWPDDQFWLPRILRGEILKGDFYFDRNLNSLLSYELINVEQWENK